MKFLVLFDSNYGNTQKIAEATAKELGTEAVSVANFNMNNLQSINLLVVGSPINGWRPSEKMGEFLAGLKKDQFKGIKAAAFDTRIKVWFSGDAVNKIASLLKKAGAEIVATEKFYVKDKEGPLVEGELERAAEWAKILKEKTQ